MTGEAIDVVEMSVEAMQEVLTEEELAIYGEFVLKDVDQFVTDEGRDWTIIENEKYILECAEIIKKIRGSR